jgi:replicative DNA helicase
MSAEQLANRMLSSEAQIDSYKMRSGALTAEDWSAIAHASSRLAETDLLIDDTPGISVTAMKSKLRRVKNLGLVVIDYLQLMQSDRRNDNRVQEVAEISRNLKLLAKELRVPVICCAQLSRGPEGRTDKRPMLSDLRDSGAIEQDADVVMFLYREEYYKNNAEGQSAAEVIVAKNRHGAVRNVPIGWLPQYTKFITLEKSQEPEG